MIVYFDTNIVIYAVQNPAVFGPKTSSRLTALRTSGDTFMASDLTRMECLVVPLLGQGHPGCGHHLGGMRPSSLDPGDDRLQANGRPPLGSGGRTWGRRISDQ